jgi:hypothetical protein
METILFLLGIVLPFGSYGIFGYAFGSIANIFSKNTGYAIEGILNLAPKNILSWVLGLELHLLLSFGMYQCLGMPVFSAFWCSFVILLSISLLILQYMKALMPSISSHFSFKNSPKFTLNGVIFFTITFWIGITIFSVGDGIKTFWANNYGDIAIHFGLIMNYIHGAVPLRDYHIFPGEYLSYSVLVDFWSALLLSASPTLRNMHIVFVIQWTLIWMLSYVSLNRFGHKVFPWIVLLGGGTWIQFLSNVDLFHYTSGLKGYSHILIDKGFGVTNLLACIWIPQRTTLYGLLTLTVGLSAFGDLYLKRSRNILDTKSNVGSLFQLGALFGISFFANFHMALVGGVIIAFYLLLNSLRETLDSKKLYLSSVYFYITLLFFSYFAYRHYSGKEGMITFANGWMNTDDQEIFSYLIKFWSLNLTILIIPILYFLSRLNLTLIITFIGLFLFGNFVSLSSWEWDNYKLFIGLFVSILILSGYRTRPRELIEIMLILSIFPGMYETGKSVTFDKESVIYSPDDLYKAEQMRANTPKNAIIAGAPDHNSPISMAGRKIFYGYAGWLDSHNIEGDERQEMNSDFQLLKECSKKPLEICPDYVLDDNFHRDDLVENGFIQTAVPFLFKVPKPI